jgi:Ca2+/Na+ antiporter
MSNRRFIALLILNSLAFFLNVGLVLYRIWNSSFTPLSTMHIIMAVLSFCCVIYLVWVVKIENKRRN